ncbi:MAG: RNA-binding protein [Clostridia bacterium]|nr:RNA-binding protein [Clostridia bacterium]
MLAEVLKVGQLVYSRAGRDRGRPFLIWQVCSDRRVYMVDGSLRTTAKPKLKNIIHIQAAKAIDTEIAERLSRGEKVTDAEIRQAISRLTATQGT